MKTGTDFESELEKISTSDPSSPEAAFVTVTPFRSTCQGLFSLVGSAVTKMMSSMSYSPQPELFARSLRRRLQSLTPDRSCADSSSVQNGPEAMFTSEDDQPRAMGVPLAEECEEERIRRILERGLKMHNGGNGSLIKINSFPLPGTTFPPNRFVNGGDLVKLKCRSESDLFPALENSTAQASARAETNENDSETPHDLIHESVGEVCDSDLFFDFDIGSPEPEAEVNIALDHVINDADDGMLRPSLRQASPSVSNVSSNSPTLLDANSGSPQRRSPSTTQPSTAYGSTSSGLYSDPEVSIHTEHEEEGNAPDVLEGFSLYPEDWIKNQQTPFSRTEKSPSVTPVLSPSNTHPIIENVESSPEIIEPVESPPPEIACAELNVDNCATDSTTGDPIIEIGGEESSKDVSDSSDESLTGGEGKTEVKLCIGETEKFVAQSKLQALLAQLEKGKDFGTEMGPKNVQHSSSEPKLLSTSPANFSFLCGSVGANTTNNNLSAKSTMGRCQSTLDMSEYDKSKVQGSTPRTNDQLFAEAKSKMRQAEESKKSEEEESDKKDKYRKCSSLRSGKTPPGTPARRKIVRFADVFGLDLADVKTFLDEVPNVPKSAFRDLKDAELSDMDSDAGSELHFPVLPPTGPPMVPTFRAPSTGPTIAPLFNQPSGSSEFFNHLRDKKVCLESAYMSDLNTIKGTVRVVNLDYNKRVVVICTTDDWADTTEVAGEYLVGSCDGFSDKFSFLLDYSAIAGMVGRRLQFCVKFECAGNDYWDNNFGKNYIFQCFGPSPSIPVSQTKSVPISRQNARHNNSSTNVFSTFSHSPSALHEDPWLRYL